MKKRREGFTLVEMMVVIVIIGILAGIVIVNISGNADKAKVKMTETLLKQVGGQIELFHLNHSRYPDSLIDLVRQPAYIDVKEWPRGGYLMETPHDGWGNELFYRPQGTGGLPFDLMSYGEDGKEGGDGLAGDLWYRKQQR
jgi:general secretion pathway protein G